MFFRLEKFGKKSLKFNYILYFVPDYEEMNILNVKLTITRSLALFQIGLTSY